MNGKKVFTGRVKLDSTNWNEEKKVYEAETAYKDGEVVKFTYSPEGGITDSGIDYIGRVQVEGAERPTNIKEKQTERGVWVYGCVDYDADRRCNMRKGQSTDGIPTFTISFSKPAEEKNLTELAKEIEVEEGETKKETKAKEEAKTDDDDLPF